MNDLERSLLLRVLDTRSELALQLPDGIDWSRLVERARFGKVLPLLADAVTGAGVDVPAAVQQQLRDQLQETAVYNTRLLGELARTSQLLQQAGIEHVVLKGAVLLVGHYPRPAMRHAVDVDLLIEPARLDEALELLLSGGYREAPKERLELGPDGEPSQALLPDAHACVPIKGPSGATLDLHHRLPVTGFDASGGFTGWRARARMQTVQGVQVPMCDSDDLAVHLIEHFAVQNWADPRDLPRTLADLRTLYPQGPPWERLARGPVGQRLAVLAMRPIYDAAFDPPAAANPAEQAVTALLQRLAVADPSTAPLMDQLCNFRAHASRIVADVRHRPRYALRTVFPSRRYLAQRYGVDPRSPRIYPLYLSRLWVALVRPVWPRDAAS